jgi:hypothetical protein
MLTRNKPDAPGISTGTYFAKNVRTDERCRGGDPVIGEIERAVGKACVFSDLGVHLREVSDGDNSFCRYYYARMFSNKASVQLRVKGKYLLDNIRVETLGIGGECEHDGSFSGEVEVKLEYDKGAAFCDIVEVVEAIRNSGLRRNRKA